MFSYTLDGTAKFGRTYRTLDFDIEVRPLGWYGGDFVHKEVTVIAWAWADGDPYDARAAHLTTKSGSAERMLKAFKKVYDEADIVAGHYIRGFDLPLLNTAYAEYGLEGLGPKLTLDTKGDLVGLSGISKSQQNLASWLGIDSPKVNMTMEDWRRANRLVPEGIEFAVERAIGDVLQNIEMLAALKERKLIRPPKLWEPKGGQIPAYEA